MKTPLWKLVVFAAASLWLAFHVFVHAVLTTLGVPCP